MEYPCILHIGGATVTILATSTLTSYADGTWVHATHYDAEGLGQATTAKELGYPDVRSMNEDHDSVHHLLAGWLGLSASPTLHGLAHGLAYSLAWQEEDAVKAIQRWMHSLGLTAVQVAQQGRIA